MMTFLAKSFDAEPPSGLQFLVQSYRIHRSDIVTIGFGATSSDRFVLEHVDVPVIIRDQHRDQNQLRRTFPEAFVTTRHGPLGWGEAILGGLAYESDETGMMGLRAPIAPY
jgi:predicted mannosyl-3-phosphoglycerate phosphatase (HAD superfamily)